MASKEGIQFIVEYGDPRAGVFQERVEIATASAVPQLDSDFESGLPERAEIDQLAQLRRALDVAPEQDETTRLYAPKQFHGFRVEFFTRNAREDELTE